MISSLYFLSNGPVACCTAFFFFKLVLLVMRRFSYPPNSSIVFAVLSILEMFSFHTHLLWLFLCTLSCTLNAAIMSLFLCLSNRVFSVSFLLFWEAFLLVCSRSFKVDIIGHMRILYISTLDSMFMFLLYTTSLKLLDFWISL